MSSIRHRLDRLERADGLACPECGWPEVTVNVVWPDDPRPPDTGDSADACCEVCGRPFWIRLVWKDALEDLSREETTNRRGGN